MHNHSTIDDLRSFRTPDVSPTADGWNNMPITIGLIAGGVCALFFVLLLYSYLYYRKLQRKVKVRRHVNMMQASDAALHTPIGPLWTTEISSHVLHDTVRTSRPQLVSSRPQLVSSRPQLVSSRPRQPSVDGTFSSSGITLKSEVLDASFYNGTFKKKNRMNGDLAQAIAAFGLPRGSIGTGLRRWTRSNNCNNCNDDYSDDRRELSTNMEVIYQERTAV